MKNMKIDYNFYEGDERQFQFRAWKNRRVYVNDYKGRAFGYIDIETKEYKHSDWQGLFQNEREVLMGHINNYIENM